MQDNSKAQQRPTELTFRVIVLSIILALILAASNAFLALKIGILASASIPAAIISMGILRFYKNASVLENNLVQTAASAGEAVAGGVVYTAPALILIHYWNHFSYWENFLIALLGGWLGVLFSIPIRRVLVTHPDLRFPEGKAIAEILLTDERKQSGLREMLAGGALGAMLELCQSGFKLIASQMQEWIACGRTVMGFGVGFSPAMLGVGYLVGFRLGISLLSGAILLWFLGVPIFGLIFPELLQGTNPANAVVHLSESKLRYVAIGAMLFAGLMTVSSLLKPFVLSMQESYRAFTEKKRLPLPETERDAPLNYVLLGVICLLLALFVFFHDLFPLFSGNNTSHVGLVLTGVIYVFILGFIFSAITGYFSGMVGVTASPGSAIIIASLIIAALGLRFYLEGHHILLLDNNKLNAAAITIMLGAVITGIAAIANDNIQDLKVGHLVGATPWKQQVMLMLGVFVSALVIPLVMQLLFDVYGIGDVFPRPGMDSTLALPAPPAAVMAAVTQAVFNYSLEWTMIGIGAGAMVLIKVSNYFLPERYRLSLLGVAIGMYLPLATSIPLFLGGCISLINKKVLQQQSASDYTERAQRPVLIACGLVSGAAVMSILLAIPFSIAQNPDVLVLFSSHPAWISNGLGIITTALILGWMYKSIYNKK